MKRRGGSLGDHLARHEELRHAVGRLTSVAAAPGAAATREPADVVVTMNEMNDRHGTGVLVRRVFAGCKGIVSVRSRNDYGGDHGFGDVSVVLSQKGFSRADAYRRALATFEGRDVRRVVCVPFTSEDLLTSIALRDAFGARLGVWIMDDQNVAFQVIPDDLMREMLEKCSLRLTTHPEMRQAYEGKYGLPFSLLPAVAPGSLVMDAIAPPEALNGRGALVGNIWARSWFDRLSRTLSRSGHRVDWYGDDRSPYVKIGARDLEASGIRPRGLTPEPELVPVLRTYSFTIVPTGVLEEDVGSPRVLAQLSLPGRILFAAATSTTPVVVLGSEDTSAARFVRRFGIGLCCPYRPDAFAATVSEIVRPDVQERMRRNALRIARTLSADGVGEWFWRSLDKGAPADDRFERLFPRSGDEPLHLPGG